jgi:hypothetical protein
MPLPINGIKEKPSSPPAHQESPDKKIQNLAPEGEPLELIQDKQDNKVLENHDDLEPIQKGELKTK